MSNFGVNEGAVVVAVDIDEVLARFVYSLSRFHNDVYSTCLSESDFHSYAFHEVWGGTASECTAKMEEFYLTKYFREEMTPVQGALDGLRWLKEQTGCELHIVTARQHSLEKKTREWISAHYPGIFASISFGNHYGATGRKKSKPEMCREIGAVCLIDDSQIYAGQCAEAGIPCVLFGDYAWNSHSDKPGGATWSASVATQEYAHLVHKASDWVQARVILRDIISNYDKYSTIQTLPSNRSASISIVQLCSGNDKRVNLEKIDRFVRESARSGSSLVCLPECCVFLGKTSTETVENAERVSGGDSPSIQAIQQMALANSIGISVGGFAVPSTGSKILNRHLIISADGNIVASYDKIHLFDNPLTDMWESNFTEPGNELVSVGEEAGLPFKTGLTICYDLRFPEMFGKLSRDKEDGVGGGHGSEVILVPSAFMKKTGEAHWETLLRARAIENGCFIVAAAQVGRHNGTERESFGNSLIIDPWGKDVTRMDDFSEGVAHAVIDRELVFSARKSMPCHSHRRPECY